MKLSLAFVASLYLTVRAATSSPERTDQNSCPPPISQVPLYRAHHPLRGEFFYTTKKEELNEYLSIGYIQEGTAGYIFATQEASTVPLYHLYSAAYITDLYTTEKSEVIYAVENGWFDNGITGYLFRSQVCGSKPLFRLLNANHVSHFYTVNTFEREIAINVLGYTEEPAAGYIIALSP